MKFNMICIKFDQKIKKPKFWTFEVFLKKDLKNLGFSKPFSSPGGDRGAPPKIPGD